MMPDELLAFEAPAVIDALVRVGTASDAADARLLFRELLRYLWLCRVMDSSVWPVFSLRVDEAWHQFILLGEEYPRFCARFFQQYVHHPPAEQGRPRPWGNRLEFATRYVELYGVELPPVWDDENFLSDARRLARSRQLELCREGRRVQVRSSGRTLFACGERAEAALRFIAGHGVFYVRELPGLRPDERVALCKPLVRARALRVAL